MQLRTMDNWLSNKFRWMSVVAMWAVVCIHARTDRWSPSSQDFGNVIQAHVADLFHFAVPLFFVISGYMFVGSCKRHGYVEMLKIKFRTLYVPMVIWAFVSVLALLPIRFYAHHDIPTFFDVLLIPLMRFPSGTVHFWYVRALLLLAVALPVVAFCIRRMWLTFALMTLALAIPEGTVASTYHVPVTLFFFLGGCVLARGGGIAQTLHENIGNSRYYLCLATGLSNAWGRCVRPSLLYMFCLADSYDALFMVCV